jgi:signal transduction histidine kinase
LTVRSKLVAIVAVDAFALLVLVLASWLIERQVDRQLQNIQDTYVPRIGLRPRLERSFEQVNHSLQDAAASGDADLLAEAARSHEELLGQIAAAADAVPAAEIAALRAAIERYFTAALAVSRRMIAGESGEDLLTAIAEMQLEQAAAAALLDRTTRFDEDALAESFTSAADAQQAGDRMRLIVGAVCMISIIGLSIWIGRSLFGSLGGLAAGFRRFGAGDFATPIPIVSSDELGDLAQQANLMARDLRDARSRLDQKAEELARASAYKSQFLASMSHELRTPLNAIIGFSELMCDGLVSEPAKQKEFSSHILASGRHLLGLINDILDLSKVEAGRLELNPEPVILTEVVGEVLGILGTTAANRQVAISSSIDPAVDELVLDPARLKQVLYNYLSNAIKFTPAGGRVEIRGTSEPGDAVRLEVEDTGVGISAADLLRLFGEFQQVGDLSKKHEGTGLGLVLTKRLVEAQGGTVGVRSVVGKGSVFHAVLPTRLTRPG